MLVEFRQCIQERLLRHYFYPRFNLLSIKLTRDAQTELLQLFGIIVQDDITIIKACNTLSQVWSRLITINDLDAISEMRNKNIVRNDECTFSYASILLGNIMEYFAKILPQTFVSLFGTRLASLMLKYYAWSYSILSLQPYATNRDMYKLHRLANNDIASFDISTCKIWYAMVLLIKADYIACLSTVNDVLSRIPPYALYASDVVINSSNESKFMYGYVYQKSDTDIMERARTSWLMDLRFTKDMLDNVPYAIHVELSFCDQILGLFVSPFTFAYYLMFLCYHELRQYGDRDCALRLLVDVVNNPEQCGAFRRHSNNIAGHCLLLAGQRDLIIPVYKRKSFRKIQFCFAVLTDDTFVTIRNDVSLSHDGFKGLFESTLLML